MADGLFEVAYVGYVREQWSEVSYTLSHGLYGMLLQLRLARGDGMLQGVEIDIVEQCAMHDSGVGQCIASVSADLSATDEYIVVRRGDRLQAQGLQHAGKRLYEPAEDLLAMRIGADEADHEIALVGIDAPSPALSLHNIDAVLKAIRLVDLRLALLMASEDDRRLDAPTEEQVFCGCLRQTDFLIKIPC